VSENGLEKWDYTLIDVGYVEWRWIGKPKDRARLGFSSETDWEKERKRSERYARLNDADPGLLSVSVAWDAADGSWRPLLAVLRDFGANGWEVVGWQSGFLLKRPLVGSGAD
jgi:hypothetical protein